MGRLGKYIWRVLCLGPALVAALWFLCAPTLLHAQTVADTREGMNRYVRDLVNETDTLKYLPDSTLDRMIHYAHRTTMLALGKYTAVDVDTIICTQGKQQYSLSSDFLTTDTAIVGRVVGIMRRVETNQGVGDVGFVEVDFTQVGKLGEGVIPNSYKVEGDNIILGTAPTGGDTLFVYYEPLADILDAYGDALTVASEDVPAVAYLTASQVYLRDHQLQLGQMYWQMWQTLVTLKRPQTAVPPQ